MGIHTYAFKQIKPYKLGKVLICLLVEIYISDSVTNLQSKKCWKTVRTEKSWVKNKLAGKKLMIFNMYRKLFISSYKQQQQQHNMNSSQTRRHSKITSFLFINIKINPLYKTIMPWLYLLHRNVVTNNRLKKVQTINLFFFFKCNYDFK